jgi:His Kinase A (phospho-acceptor) domain
LIDRGLGFGCSTKGTHDTGKGCSCVEELEIAIQHKSQFVANKSHELRTPLAAILGYADELMQEGFYEPLGQKSLDALTCIRSNGKLLLGLINTVLDIAKIESGQFALNMAECALESVVETVRSATESLAQNKKLALKTEVAKSIPIGLGDEQRLTQWIDEAARIHHASSQRRSLTCLCCARCLRLCRRMDGFARSGQMLRPNVQAKCSGQMLRPMFRPNVQADGIAMSSQPNAVVRTRSPGCSSTEVVAASITAGPSISWPAASASKS